MGKFTLKIRVGIGTVTQCVDSLKLQSSKCKQCGKSILLVKMLGNKKFLVEKDAQGYVSHFLQCPYGKFQLQQQQIRSKAIRERKAKRRGKAKFHQRQEVLSRADGDTVNREN